VPLAAATTRVSIFMASTTHTVWSASTLAPAATRVLAAAQSCRRRGWAASNSVGHVPYEQDGGKLSEWTINKYRRNTGIVLNALRKLQVVRLSRDEIADSLARTKVMLKRREFLSIRCMSSIVT